MSRWLHRLGGHIASSQMGETGAELGQEPPVGRAHRAVAAPERDGDLAIRQIGEEQIEELAFRRGEAMLASGAKLVVAFVLEQLLFRRWLWIFPLERLVQHNCGRR